MKFNIYRPEADDNAGLFARFFRVLHALELCGTEPLLVDFRSIHDYYDPKIGGNVWEYFFEQPSPYNLEEVLAEAEAGRAETSVSSYMPFNGYRYGFVNYSADFSQELLSFAKMLVMRHIDFKPAIKKIFTENTKGWDSRKTLGVQRRGTDYFTNAHAAGQNLPIERHFAAVDAAFATGKYEQMFLVTDEKWVSEAFKQRYGSLVFQYPGAIMSDDDGPVHHKDWCNNYEKGESIVIQVLMLSVCHDIICMSSNISSAARVLGVVRNATYVDKDIKYV